jgi:glutathione synthase/RimK-type ligase-like ATP-grasp enzyme
MSNNKSIVLVLTGSDDPMWPFLLESCSASQREKIVMFPTDSPQTSQISMNPKSGELVFNINGVIIRSSEIKSVWWRRIIPPKLNDHESDIEVYCSNEYQEFFAGLEYLMPEVLWVSLPSAIRQAENKVNQLMVAKSLGFTTLDGIFTNSPSRAISFIKKGESIYKSIRSPRIPVGNGKTASVFTTMIGENNIPDINGIISCPGIFQRFCEKKSDIRVTIFGEDVFAVEIDSQSDKSSEIDFRLTAKDLPHAVHNLPNKVLEQCLSLVSELNLNYGAIDLALMDDGSYVFFEINPNGQWGWIEEKTLLPMRQSLLSLLFK